MSEANPTGQRNDGEINALIRELERQIESVNDGMARIRGTVARITYAVGAPTPGQSRAPNGYSGAPANRYQWQQPVTEAPVVQPPGVEAPAVQAPEPEPRKYADIPSWTNSTPWPETPSAEPEPAATIWDSVAEGASWPTAQPAAPKQSPADAQALWSEPATETPAESPASDTAWPTPSPASDTAWPTPSSASTPGQPAESYAWEAPQIEEPEPASAISGSPAEDYSWQTPVADRVEEPIAEAAAVEEPPAAQQEPEPDAWQAPAAPEPRNETPSTHAHDHGKLSTGWPDESAWSQSFEWPAMQTPDDSAPTAAPADDDTRASVSDMVARMKAELAAAQQGEAPADLDAEPVSEHEPPAPEAPLAQDDDEAQRAEVSRAVAEIRQQIQAGDFESAIRNHSYYEGADPGSSDPAAEAAGALSDEAAREEVRRAVEAAREDLAAGREAAVQAEKPAFKLAAPGALPDWSHMQMEPSGPPVVVLKDVDGRVELASVYETLNELGCGDGAALLNYTPHSVTVGLPVTARFPSQQQVADAVEKVFGLASRVESDGVRITVSIGVDPKKRSVDAA